MLPQFQNLICFAAFSDGLVLCHCRVWLDASLKHPQNKLVAFNRATGFCSPLQFGRQAAKAYQRASGIFTSATSRLYLSYGAHRVGGFGLPVRVAGLPTHPLRPASRLEA